MGDESGDYLNEKTNSIEVVPLGSARDEPRALWCSNEMEIAQNLQVASQSGSIEGGLIDGAIVSLELLEDLRVATSHGELEQGRGQNRGRGAFQIPFDQVEILLLDVFFNGVTGNGAIDEEGM